MFNKKKKEQQALKNASRIMIDEFEKLIENMPRDLITLKVNLNKLFNKLDNYSNDLSSKQIEDIRSLVNEMTMKKNNAEYMMNRVHKIDSIIDGKPLVYDPIENIIEDNADAISENMGKIHNYEKKLVSLNKEIKDLYLQPKSKSTDAELRRKIRERKSIEYSINGTMQANDLLEKNNSQASFVKASNVVADTNEKILNNTSIINVEEAIQNCDEATQTSTEMDKTLSQIDAVYGDSIDDIDLEIERGREEALKERIDEENGFPASEIASKED